MPEAGDSCADPVPVMNRNIKKAWLFIGLTFFLNCLMAARVFAFGGKWNTPASFIGAIMYMFVPMVMAVVVQKFIYKEPLRQPLGISFRLNRWFLFVYDRVLAKEPLMMVV